jgi:hypothetical protein
MEIGTAVKQDRLIKMCLSESYNNAYHHSVRSLLSCRLFSINLKIKIYKNIILHVVLHGYEN